MAFPPTPVPSQYTTVSCSDKNGIFYVGDAVTLTLNKSGADAYTVRDYLGNTVGSGSVSGTTISLGSSWNPGWYRVYLTGPVNDAVFGTSYGAYNFCVIRNTAGFAANTSSDPTTTTGNGGSEDRDMVMCGVMGMGTQRVQVGDASTVDLANPYYPGSSPGSSYTGDSLWACRLGAEAAVAFAPTDSARTWPVLCQFPAGTSDSQGVTDAVTYLSQHGVTRFEGPSNEPNMYDAATATGMASFKTAVQAAGVGAYAVGPCAINISDTTAWDTFLTNCAGNYPDEISTHAYNFCTNGDFNLGRTTLNNWFAVLADYGLENSTIWITESTHVFTSVYGAYHPRRSRVPVIQVLLMEQYGIERTRNHIWYCRSHGYWSYPSFSEYGDGSLAPYAVLFRVLAEETINKPFSHQIDFGSVQANRIFLGSVYRDDVAQGAGTAVVVANSYMDSCTVTFDLHGSSLPSSFTVVDGFGNESTVSVSAGRITVDVSDIPTYVRLPVGVSLSVSSVLDWGTSVPVSISTSGQGRLSGGSSPSVSDNALLEDYASTSGYSKATGSPPDTADVLWNETVSVGRVIVVCASPWQANSTLVDFDIQTTTDHTNWTTRATVTKTTPSAFTHVTSSANAGCTYETYWDEQWIFPVTLPATYSCTGVRVNVRATSYGGEPTAAIDAAGLGQGDNAQHLTLQEIMVPSTSTPAAFAQPYPGVVEAHASLVGYWRFGEASGTSTAVTQKNAPTLNGTYSNTSLLGVAGAISDADTAMRTSVSVPHNALLNLGDTFTIAFWWNANGDNFSTNLYMFNKSHSADATTPVVYWTAGTFKLISAEVAGTVVATSSVTVTDHNWHLIAFTKSGATTKIYVDAVDVTSSGSNVTFTSNTRDLTLGDSLRSMDEMSIFSTALSQADIQEMYDSSIYVPSAPVISSIPKVQYGA